LDLVLQDTPLNNAETAGQLKQSVYRVDNLGDREEDKIQRVETRFARVELFLDYLESEESAERLRFQLDPIQGIIAQRIVGPIREQYEKEREWIRRRIKENRERYSDDAIFEHLEEDKAELQNLTATTHEDATTLKTDSG
jgi:hypothetical protein